MAGYRLRQSGEEVQGILDNAAMRAQLTAETERAQTVEQQLQTNIDREATARQQADGVLDGKIAAEKTRAEGAEGALQTAIGNEAQSRQQADGVLDGKIAAEKTRAEGEEGALQTAIGNEAQARQQADGVLDGKIAAEKTRAEGAEGSLQTAIDNEAKARRQTDGALDVSELNATENPHTLAKYVNLSAAIAAIPTDYQKGGMSIKFVQSSDNKYVQCRCMAQNFTTDVTQWQGVDDEPTAGSENLVKSGGVKRQLAEYTNIFDMSDFTLTNSRRIDTDGSIQPHGSFAIYSIENKGYKHVFAKIASTNTSNICIAFYSGDSVGSGYISGVTTIHTLPGTTEEIHEYSASIPSNCKIIAVCNNKAGTLTTPDIFIDGTSVLKNEIDANEYEINSRIYNCHQGQATVTAFSTNADARNAVPSKYRRTGQLFTYLSSENGGWVVEQFVHQYWVGTDNGRYTRIILDNESYKYLGDLTSYISGTGQNAVCSYDPSITSGIVKRQYTEWGNYYYTITIPAKTKVTFTNLIQVSEPFVVNNQQDKEIYYRIHKTNNYYTAFVLPINERLKEFENNTDTSIKNIEDSVKKSMSSVLDTNAIYSYKNNYHTLNGNGVGEAHGSFASYLYNNNRYGAIEATVGQSASDNTSSYIAFYDNFEISTDSYIKGVARKTTDTTYKFTEEIPSNCKLIVVTTFKASLSEPTVNLYEGASYLGNELEEVKNKLSKIKLNPTKNLYSTDCIVENKRVVVTNTSSWSIVDSVNSKIAICEISDYGTGSYVTISGLGAIRYSRIAIFLDENMEPVPSGGIYGLGTGFNVFQLNSAFYCKWKYIVIPLYTTEDYQNTNSDYGYVWTSAEIAQGFPNWINDVKVNSFYYYPLPQGVLTYDFVPNTSFGETEPVLSDTYDNSKYELFAKLRNEIIAGMSSPSSNYFNFLFGTDSHIDFNAASQRNVKDMVQFGNLSMIRPFMDCIIQNGDICTPSFVYSRQQSVYGYMKYYNIIKNSGVPFIQVSGNHDRHQENKVPVADALTYSECVNYLKEYSLHTSNYLYDYQDFEEKKVRIIKLDGYDYPLESTTAEGLEGVVKYPLNKYDCLVSQTQMEWLVSTLLSTPDDYVVILIGHIWWQNVTVPYITKILSAAVAKQSGSVYFDYSELVAPDGYSGFPYGSFTINYDFTAGNNIKVAAMLCGHDHKDSYNVINDINVIGTNCQALEQSFPQHVDGNKRYRGDYSLYQNCFNVMCLDIANNKLILKRFGWGAPTGIPYNSQTEFNY